MSPPVRPAARILLLDGQDRLLLFRIPVPRRDPMTILLTPGGGLQPGESFEAAARRELWEETGLEDVPISACVWDRRHVFTWGSETFQAHERYFVARVDGTPDVAPAHPDPQEVLDDYRWWSLAELEAGAGREVFVPRRLPWLLGPVISGVVPDEPLAVGA